MNNYYKTYVVGIDDSFEITSNSINESIGLANKKAYAQIIVKPFLGGFVEIVTGKKYKAVVMKDENDAKIPSTATFLIDDRKTNMKRMQIASNAEVKEYLKEYNVNSDKYLRKLDEIDQKCNNYLIEGKYKQAIIDLVMRH